MYLTHFHIFFACYSTRIECQPSKMQRLSIILVEKKENSHFVTKKTTVAGPNFSMTPRLRPRCQICPKNGTFVEARRPQNRQKEVPNMSFCHQKCKGRA